MPRTARPGTLLEYLDDPYNMIPVSVDLPDLENQIRQYLNRWVIGDLRPAADRELRALITLSKEAA